MRTGDCFANARNDAKRVNEIPKYTKALKIFRSQGPLMFERGILKLVGARFNPLSCQFIDSLCKTSINTFLGNAPLTTLVGSRSFAQFKIL